jgi:hypothetical protein
MRGKPTLAEGDANALINRAQEGDKGALAKALSALNADPSPWDAVGDLGRNASIAGSVWQPPVRMGIVEEAVLRKLDTMRAEFSCPDQSPLERLPIDRVLALWLQLSWAETIHAVHLRPEKRARGGWSWATTSTDA